MMPPGMIPAVGSFIRYRYKGEWFYAIMCAGHEPTLHEAVEENRIPKGAVFHECVWKERPDRLEVRRTFHKPFGPATYVPKTKAEMDADLAALFAEIDERDAEVTDMMDQLTKFFGA